MSDYPLLSGTLLPFELGASLCLFGVLGAGRLSID